jgi:3-phosphoshikimate 1-carboxyvinyltransferase
VPADFSSLSYPIALAALDGEVFFPGVLRIDPFQADSLFLDYLFNIGAKVEWRKEGLWVAKGDLRPFEIDCSLIPDLIPTLCFVASYIKGKCTLKNIKNLIYKESNRLMGIFDLFNTFKVEYQYDKEIDQLVITGSRSFNDSFEYTPAKDHRMVMTAYLYMRINGGGKLFNCDSVAKSYPEFFADLG